MMEAIAKSADVSKAAAGRALDATVACIRTSLKKGGTVTLVGFGTFYVSKRAARARVTISPSLSWMAWCSQIGLPKVWRSCA